VLVLVLSELVTKAMKGSVVESRRYRALKIELDSELRQIMDDSQPAWDAYMDSLRLVKNKRYEMRRQNYRPTHEQLGELRTLKADFRGKQRSYQAYRTQCLVLKTRLRKAEQEWMAALRDLEYEHEFILEHAKLLPVTEYPDWVEDDYKHHESIRERAYHEGDEYDGEDTNTDVSSEQDEWTAIPDHCHVQENSQKNTAELVAHGAQAQQQAMLEPDPQEQLRLHEELMKVRRHHLEQIRIHKGHVQFARKMHDDVRRSYTLIFDRYVAEHSERPKVQLECEYAPQHVALGQEWVQNLKAAEQNLANVITQAKAAGVRPGDNQYEEDDEVLLDQVIEGMRKNIEDVDRGTIERWRMADMDLPSLASTYPDSENGQDSDHTPRLRPRATSKTAVAKTIQAAEQRSHKRKARLRTQDQRKFLFLPLPPSESDIEPPQNTSDKASILSDPYGGLGERPRVQHQKRQAISTMDQDSYFRQHIDDWATKMRNGYY
jgi:hypothetical protein